MRKLIVVGFVLFLSGCAVVDWMRPEPIIKYETVEVKVPVYMKPTPPAVLTESQNYVLPVFVPLTSKGATSCLNDQGEANLKRILLNLHDRLQGWKEWSN